jgi:hypothetical protein
VVQGPVEIEGENRLGRGRGGKSGHESLHQQRDLLAGPVDAFDEDPLDVGGF